MKATSVLTVDELINMFDAVWEYNQRGKIESVVFYGPDGNPIALGSLQIIYADPDLQVRSQPEPDEQSAMKYVRSFSALDPRKVPEPQSLNELETHG